MTSATADPAQDGLDLPGVPASAESTVVITDPDAPHPHPGQCRLTHAQICNRDTFHGTHDLEIIPKGYFLMGGPGTGKPTLLDAISARTTNEYVVTAHPVPRDCNPNARMPHTRAWALTLWVSGRCSSV